MWNKNFLLEWEKERIYLHRIILIQEMCVHVCVCEYEFELDERKWFDEKWKKERREQNGKKKREWKKEQEKARKW